MKEKKVVLEGVGKDAEIVTNSNGGQQSKAPLAMHLIDPIFLRNYLEDDNFIYFITEFMEENHKEDNLISAICELNQTSSIYQPLIAISKVLKEGAEKYSPNNWRLIPQEEHLNHALIHYLAYRMGDTQDDHREHCMCRLMMAYATKPSKDFSYIEYVKDGVHYV